MNYDTYFSRFQASKKKLDELAKQVWTGDIAFGNPVTDYDVAPPVEAHSRAGEGGPTAEMGSEEPPDEEGEEEEEEPGWLDLLVDVQEGFTELTDIVNEIGEKVKTVGERATATTPELQNATKSGNIRLARQILRTLGTDYAEDVVDIAKANASYETVLGKTGNALEFLLREQSRIAGTENEQVISFMAVLQDLESNALGGKESMLQLVATMNALPRMERRFDKAKRRLISELESFVENIDQTIVMVVRVRSIADESSEASKVGDI